MAQTWKIVLFCLLFTFAPSFAEAANLSISPASGTFNVGDRVTVRIVVSSTIPINAISGTVSFPTNLFSIESISKAGSLLNFWVSEPNFSQGAGTLNFEGVTLGGFSGGSGTVVTAVLRAVKTGTGSVSFNSGQVLANDGQGTDVTDRKIGATYSVEPTTEVPRPIIEQELEGSEEVQPLPSLESPQIMLTTKFGEKAVSGVSNYPNSQVLLTFVSEEGVKVFIIGTTDDLGEFVLLVPKTLRRGHYTVYAVVIQTDLTSSHTSNEITISVGSIFSDVSWGILWPLLILFLILIYLIVRSYFYLKKNKKLKIFVRKEAREAEEIVHKSFDIIREDVGDKKELKKDLNEAENLISKEIKDIEKS